MQIMPRCRCRQRWRVPLRMFSAWLTGEWQLSVLCVCVNDWHCTIKAHAIFPACRACDYVYIDYVRRSRSSSCRLLRPINCQTYITLQLILVCNHYHCCSHGWRMLQFPSGGAVRDKLESDNSQYIHIGRDVMQLYNQCRSSAEAVPSKHMPFFSSYLNCKCKCQCRSI